METRNHRQQEKHAQALSALEISMGSSKHIQSVFKQIALIGTTNFSVLICGETGSGKELVATAIHELGQEAGHPLVPVDCGSISPTLIESQLFGHEKGAFTGADRMQHGKFEIATGGTLFLDEISNLPISLQPKLLRALQEKKIWRVGGSHPITVETRVVAASNQDLRTLVQAKKFRCDLYHRLAEFTIMVPPLRERLDDIIYLARRFISLTNAELKKSVKGISAAATKMLLSYPWPGNVRELRNVIRRAMLVADRILEVEHLEIPAMPHRDVPLYPGSYEEPNGTVSLKEVIRRTVTQVERKMLLDVLNQTMGNKAKAARILQIDYKTIHKKIREYGISAHGSRTSYCPAPTGATANRKPGKWNNQSRIRFP